MNYYHSCNRYYSPPDLLHRYTIKQKTGRITGHAPGETRCVLQAETNFVEFTITFTGAGTVNFPDIEENPPHFRCHQAGINGDRGIGYNCTSVSIRVSIVNGLCSGIRIKLITAHYPYSGPYSTHR